MKTNDEIMKDAGEDMAKLKKGIPSWIIVKERFIQDLKECNTPEDLSILLRAISNSFRRMREDIYETKI